MQDLSIRQVLLGSVLCWFDRALLLFTDDTPLPSIRRPPAKNEAQQLSLSQALSRLHYGTQAEKQKQIATQTEVSQNAKQVSQTATTVLE